MSIEAAIDDMKARISAVCKNAEIKTVKMSEEEARISVFVGAADVQPIRQATLQPTLDYLNKDGWDIQVLVYDKDHPPEVG